MCLHKIEALSHASCQFYRFAMCQVADYNIRRLFQQRFDIYQQLIGVVTQYEVHSGLDDPHLDAAVNWFRAAQSSTQRFDNLVFLDLLEVQEEIVLKTLKKSVKSAPKALSTQLAQLAASLQVNHDDLAALKVQYRYQQGTYTSYQS